VIVLILPFSAARKRAYDAARLTDQLSSHKLNSVLNQIAPAQLDLMFHALADPSRRSMVDRLCRGTASVSELAKPLDMSLPAVVQHLAVLERSGLVRSEKVGRVRTCQIEPQALRTAEQWINDRRLGWERQLDRLGQFLSEESDD
jgi:DNA-binding transcriptional ArsR family regulator